MPNLKERYNTLRAKLAGWLPESDLVKIDSTFEFARRVHAGERRASGEMYIRHPLAVAEILSPLKPDAATIQAAFLHDTLEEKPYDAKKIAKEFGDDVAHLVEGATKLDRVKIKDEPWMHIPIIERHMKERLGHERHVESLRKMLLAMSTDIRVVLIKLADRLDNMMTLKPLRPDKQRRIAQDTLEIYAPIANRLGMGEWKGELQDLAFPYVYPKEYEELQKRVKPLLEKQEAAIHQAKVELEAEFKEAGIDAEIHGRVKHLYSLWVKLQRHNNNLERIYDLIAMRIVVKNEAECYHALGIIHKLWKPLFGRIKDYIALPKPNGYQSLHTTVFGPSGHILEIQVRTQAMHAQAEQGVAAHWIYSTHKDGAPAKQRSTGLSRSELRWLEEMRKWQESLQNIDDLKPILKTDFFSDRIFCFTPAGDVFDLPAGSTPIDFAYQVHTAIGNRCIGAIVDGKNVTLTTPLKNGQIVSIRTANNQHPHRDWLTTVKTEKARSAIRVHFGMNKKKTHIG